MQKNAENSSKWSKATKNGEMSKVVPNVQLLNPLSIGGLSEIASFLSSLMGGVQSKYYNNVDLHINQMLLMQAYCTHSGLSYASHNNGDSCH